MKSIITTIAIFFSFSLLAQEKPLDYCGTQPIKDTWLSQFQKNPHLFDTRFDDTIYVPLNVHVVGDDKGNKRMSDLSVLVALNILQNDYKDSKVHFFLTDVFTHHFYSQWSEHESVLDGADMMEELNIPDGINCYFLRDGAGNCGYNLPYGGMVVSNNCANSGDHTWAHEMGHGLSLPHPFLGWEGGVSWDGSISHSFSNPAPEKVTINYTYFKDTLIRDTLIIDTVYVEKVDGSNCHFAADGFCDTSPDYLASRWPCSESNHLSQTEQTDPNGEKFKSDGTLIMSYADDACAARFSQEQMEAMRANLKDQKSELLYDQEFKNPVTNFDVNLQKPFDEEVIHYQNIELEWEAVDSADFYLIQLSTFSGFQIVNLDTMVSTNYLNFDELKNNEEYYWRVMPFNSHHFEIEFSESNKFITAEIVNVENLNNEIKCIPTVVNRSEDFLIQLDNNTPFDEIMIFDINNQLVFSEKNVGVNQLRINTKNWKSGIHFIRIRKDSKSGISKIIVL